MDARRAQRFLVIAFSISILAHLIFALIVRAPWVVHREQVQVASLVVRSHAVQIVHRQPVPPPPPPSARPIPTSAATSAATVPSNTGRAVEGKGAETKLVATPTPAPTPFTSGCVKPNAPAGISVEPTPADIPLAARAKNTTGTASILVKVDATGAVTSTTVATSSGNPDLDIVAMTDARNAQYAPAYQDCKPVEGEYTFRRKFVPF